MKFILLAATLLLMADATSAQTNIPQTCTLKFSQAPAVRGVKLGMMVDELLPLFPVNADSTGISQTLAAAEGYPRFGDASFSISPISWANKERFTGINSYFFHTFDHKVIALTVQYDGFPKGARWKTTDDLVERLSESYHLPGPKEWLGDPNGSKKLKCDGFEVEVFAGEQPFISFYTRDWERTKRDRLTAFEDQKRREFKP